MGKITQAVCSILTCMWCLVVLVTMFGIGPFQEMPIIPVIIYSLYCCCGSSASAAIPAE